MGGRSVRVLHISDLHMRSVDGPQAERARLEAASRWRGLDPKWTANLAEIRRDGIPVDLVVFSGDLGDWGHPADYPRALALLRQTGGALDVPLRYWSERGMFWGDDALLHESARSGIFGCIAARAAGASPRRAM